MVQMDAAPVSTAAVASNRPREHREAALAMERTTSARGGSLQRFSSKGPHNDLAFWTGTRPRVVGVSPSIVPFLYSKRTAVRDAILRFAGWTWGWTIERFVAVSSTSSRGTKVKYYYPFHISETYNPLKIYIYLKLSSFYQ